MCGWRGGCFDERKGWFGRTFRSSDGTGLQPIERSESRSGSCGPGLEDRRHVIWTSVQALPLSSGSTRSPAPGGRVQRPGRSHFQYTVSEAQGTLLGRIPDRHRARVKKKTNEIYSGVRVTGTTTGLLLHELRGDLMPGDCGPGFPRSLLRNGDTTSATNDGREAFFPSDREGPDADRFWASQWSRGRGGRSSSLSDSRSI